MEKKKPLMFDQHFLIDPDIQKKLLSAACLSKQDVVIEIGPGKGALSTEIARKVKHLICIEIDSTLESSLKELQSSHTNIQVIWGNVLDMSLPDCTKIISNLPFSILEPFVQKLIDCEFEKAVFIIGNRFISNVESGSISRLNLIANCFFHWEKICEIAPSSIEPKPRILSAMIRLKKKHTDRIGLEDS